MNRMPTGPNEMAPLSEFVVTERKPKAKERINVFDWFLLQGLIPEYTIQVDDKVLGVWAKEPNDYECYVVPSTWQIKWLA